MNETKTKSKTLPIPAETEVLSQTQVPNEIYSDPSTNPTDIIYRNSSFIKLLAQKLGVSISELKTLMETGMFDKVLSMELQSLSHMALEEIFQRLEDGTLENQDLIKIASSFAELGQKLGGRNINKSVILSAESLEKLLEETWHDKE